MADSRYATAILGIVASVIVSLLAWWYLDTLLFFLLIPFVPFLFRSRGDGNDARIEPATKRCPECGFRTRDPSYGYCPRDGSRLAPG